MSRSKRALPAVRRNTMLDSWFMMAYLGEHYPAEQMKGAGHLTLLDAMCWFVANQIAGEMEGASRKDLATFLMGGFGGVKSRDAVQQYLDTCWDRLDYETDEEAAQGLKEVTRELEESLRTFFALKKDNDDEQSKQRAQGAN